MLASIFRRKLQTFVAAPRRSVRSQILRTARGCCEIHGKYMLRRNGVTGDLESFVAARPPGSLQPVYADLWRLYRIVRRRRPGVVPEFWCGCSTVILARALRDLRDEGSVPAARLYSIDAEPFWAEAARGALPPHLREICEVLYSPLLEIDYEGVPGFRHARIPDVRPDLVYIDGPALTPVRKVAVDVLDLEKRLPPGACVVVDGRTENTEFLRKRFQRRFRFRRNRLLFSHEFVFGAEQR